MNQQAEPSTKQKSAARDGLAALAILLLTVGLIVLVVSSLV